MYLLAASRSMVSRAVAAVFPDPGLVDGRGAGVARQVPGGHGEGCDDRGADRAMNPGRSIAANTPGTAAAAARRRGGVAPAEPDRQTRPGLGALQALRQRELSASGVVGSSRSALLLRFSTTTSVPTTARSMCRFTSRCASS